MLLISAGYESNICNLGLVRSLQIGQEKRNGTAEREFILSVYLCLVPLFEAVAFLFLLPRFIAKLFLGFSLPNQIMFVVSAGFMLLSIWNAVRFAHHRLVRRWQLDIAIFGSIFVFIFALGEIYYIIFPLALDLGSFHNALYYAILCPFATIAAVGELMYRRMPQYRKWYDEHYRYRRWNETYFNYDP